MPYYRGIRRLDMMDATRRYIYKGNPVSTVTGKSPRAVVNDISFRTHAPDWDVVHEVERRTMEPYTWFVDLNNMKIKTAIEHGGFDASKFREDTGHPWEHERYQIEGTPWNFSWNNSVGDRYEHWGAYPSLSAGSLSTNFNIPATGLEAWAANQYGRMAPSAVEFSLSNFLGELREGLPRFVPELLKPRVRDVKAAGSDYLNVQFGWKPLLNDLQSAAEALLSASVGLYRPFGSFHRKRAAKPIELFTREDFSSLTNIGFKLGPGQFPAEYQFGLDGSGLSGQSQARGIGSLVSRSKIWRWAEGEFVYLPKAGFDHTKYQDRLETLMSLDITPSVLWELAPWSWLVDWFADIGNSLASMEAAISNRVVSTYLYAMERTETSVAFDARVLGTSSTSVIYDGPRDLHYAWNYTRKRRVRANPFGYSGSPSTTLDGSQMAILGALGLTKLR